MADIFISEYQNYPLVSVYIDDKLSFLSLVRESDLGSVYLCRVDNILDNLQSAFVRFGAGKIGYVPFKSILPSCVTNRSISSSKELRQGDEILLQVDTEEIKLKKAKLTSHISVSGQYSVITLGRRGVGASLKLSEDVRSLLIAEIKKEYPALLSEYSNALSEAGFGVIIRTESAELPIEEAVPLIIA
ncbi:MAG: hypothetical protein J5959_07075, partial [Butyrivibrio sp.]|nr:hypothetical protein [Butyrivibrio sp.]